MDNDILEFINSGFSQLPENGTTEPQPKAYHFAFKCDNVVYNSPQNFQCYFEPAVTLQDAGIDFPLANVINGIAVTKKCNQKTHNYYLKLSEMLRYETESVYRLSAAGETVCITVLSFPQPVIAAPPTAVEAEETSGFNFYAEASKAIGRLADKLAEK